jgi:hypothetical protein
MYDSKGLICQSRKDLDPMKQLFANHNCELSFEDAFKGADVFLGLSRAGLVSKEMIATMADNPIVFALANPEPEISYKDATSVRKDIIMATGRSDHPNQVNNVLGFPFIAVTTTKLLGAMLPDNAVFAPLPSTNDSPSREMTRLVVLYISTHSSNPVSGSLTNSLIAISRGAIVSVLC